LEQADGVTGWRGVKDDVFVVCGQSRVDQQRREFIEGGDFRGARTGELFLDPFDDRFGQDAPHRADDSIPIGLCCCLWVNFQCRQVRYSGDRRDVIADAFPEHLAYVRSRVSADEQDALAF